MKNLIVISKLNGQLDKLKEIIEYYKGLEKSLFIFLGDYFSDCSSPIELTKYLNILNYEYNCVFLSSKTEEFIKKIYFPDLLDKKSIIYNFDNKIIENIWDQYHNRKTFLKAFSDIDIKQQIFYDFIKKLEYSFSYNNYIFSNSGFSRNKIFNQNTINDFVWGTEPFGLLYSSNLLMVYCRKRKFWCCFWHKWKQIKFKCTK